MKDKSLLTAGIVGAFSGMLVGAGTFYYAQLVSLDGDFSRSHETRKGIHGAAAKQGLIRENPYKDARFEPSAKCNEFIGTRRYDQCVAKEDQLKRDRQGN